MFKRTEDLVIGVDVSKWQAPKKMDYKAIASDGVAFGIARVAYGGKRDSTATAHIWGFREHGIVPGAYGFALMGECPRKQAELQSMYATQAGWRPSIDLPFFLDVERPPEGKHREKHDSMSREERVVWIYEYMLTFIGLTGRRPGVYSGPTYWGRYIATEMFSGHPYWAARYPLKTGEPNPLQWLGKQPASTAGWGQDFKIWQYTGQGKVNGYPGKIDKNIMRRSDLDARLFSLQNDAQVC